MAWATESTATAIFVLCIYSLFPLSSHASAQPAPVLHDRDPGSNDIDLRCRVNLPEGGMEALRGAKFYVNETSQELPTLLSSRGIQYTASTEEGSIQFRLPQDLEAEYYCGHNDSYRSQTAVELLHYPSAAPTQRHYARAAGGSVTLICGVNEGALSQSYTPHWYHGFTQLDTTGNDPRFSLQREPGQDYSLTINTLEVTDSGAMYHCVVEVDFSGQEAEKSAEGNLIDLVVYDDPAITVSPTDTVILAQDGSVTFICDIQGSPNLDLAWYHNHQLVQPGSGHTVSAKYDINETSQDAGDTMIRSELTIMTSLSMADSGVVRCVASTLFSDDSRTEQNRMADETATLTVLDDSFTITTIVTQTGDLQPQLTLPSPLPSLTNLIMRYSPTDGTVALEHTSSSAYFNVSRIYHFVPNSAVPSEMTKFRLQIALKVGQTIGPFTPQRTHEAPVIDINDPNEFEDCEGLSDSSIVTIVCSSVAGVVAMGVLGIVCVCCAVRTWGRVRKLPTLTEYHQQLFEQKVKLLENRNLPEDSKQKEIEKIDKEINKLNKRIGKLASDDGTQNEEVNSNPSHHSAASAGEHS